MAYLDQGNSKNKTIAFIAVAVLHALLGYAFVTGLATKMASTVLQEFDIIEVEEAPLPDEEPPPPPEQMEEIEVYVPEIDLPIELPPPPAPPKTVTAQTTTPTRAPVVVAPPAPKVEAPKVVRTAAKPSRRNASAITNDDYPSASLRAEEEGIVGVTFTIDTNGRAVNCSVTRASGFPRLDERTCSLIERRFRFDPATENGQPVAEQQTQNVRWQIQR